MNKDKKICLLLVPLIFIILLFVPRMIFVPKADAQGMPEVIWNISFVMLASVFIIWTILLYPNRRIYCDAGCIYGHFLDMDIEAKEGECNVLYCMACPLCIVNLYVLEVGRSISCNDDCVIKVLGFAISREICP
ncbi:MAG: hypothetical protein HDR18_15960 [Lachnospiraceae bacterium]|nr:hypothetical protein [Lachnospiraceae bacterium]